MHKGRGGGLLPATNTQITARMPTATEPGRLEVSYLLNATAITMPTTICSRGGALWATVQMCGSPLLLARSDYRQTCSRKTLMRPAQHLQVAQ
jgi:hypothetical protein